MFVFRVGLSSGRCARSLYYLLCIAMSAPSGEKSVLRRAAAFLFASRAVECAAEAASEAGERAGAAIASIYCEHPSTSKQHAVACVYVLDFGVDNC